MAKYSRVIVLLVAAVLFFVMLFSAFFCFLYFSQYRSRLYSVKTVPFVNKSISA